MSKKLNDHLTTKLPGYLEFFERLVTTNSFTANPDGVNAVGQMIAKAFSPLGFKAEFIPSQNPDFGKHIVLTRKGKTGKKIGMITHLDTVFPPEEEADNDFAWRVEGDRIYGPGTNDIKGGTVMMLMVLEALQWFAPQAFEDITWVLLGNAAEERWSVDFGDLCRERLSEGGLAALVFEAGYVDEGQCSLVASRKGMAIYDIHVEGKSAHAGNSHRNGGNAILQMAHLIQDIAALTDYERDLTFNVGVVSGGTVPNRVPHFATARGEMRTFSKEVFHQALSALLALQNLPPVTSHSGDFACKIDIQVLQTMEPWPRNPGTDSLISIWKETAQSIGMSVFLEARGGLSDGNQLWDLLPTVDGLGPNGRNAHCSERNPEGGKEQEYVTLSSFVPKAMLNTLAILNLIEKSSAPGKP